MSTCAESIAVNAWCDLLLATPNTLVLDSRYPREHDWPDVRVVTFRRMIYSDYWYEKRLKSTLYRESDGFYLYSFLRETTGAREIPQRGNNLLFAS